MEKGRIFGGDKFNKLALKMKNGDREAAQEIYKHLIKKVYGFCMSKTGSKSIAEDLTQDIFLKIIEKISLFDEKKGDFIVWFWQIARNAVIDYFREKKEILIENEENELEEIKSEKDCIDLNLDTKLALEKIREFLKTMTSDDQELFHLRFAAEMSYKEIADTLGKSEVALRVASLRLKEKIQNHFQNYK